MSRWATSRSGSPRSPATTDNGGKRLARGYARPTWLLHRRRTRALIVEINAITLHGSDAQSSAARRRAPASILTCTRGRSPLICGQELLRVGVVEGQYVVAQFVAHGRDDPFAVRVQPSRQLAQQRHGHTANDFRSAPGDLSCRDDFPGGTAPSHGATHAADEYNPRPSRLRARCRGERGVVAM